jgi:hypothetical protein
MSRLARRLPVAAVLVLSFSVFAALAVQEIPHLGGMTLDGSTALRFYGVDERGLPVILQETGPFPARPGSWTAVHDSLFVTVGSTVYRHDRRVSDLPRLDSWSSSNEILSLADGPERGLVLVLDRRALTLVRFPDSGSPTALWSLAIDASGLSGPHGRLLVRNGNHAYVADPALPGVRVISIDSDVEPSVVATYESNEGVVHDIALWGTALALLAENTVAIIDIGSMQDPVFSRLGSYATTHRALSTATSSRHTYVADGADLLVFENDPASNTFLASPVAAWVAPSEIRAVRLDRQGRAFVLLGDSWEILDVSAVGDR